MYNVMQELWSDSTFYTCVETYFMRADLASQKVWSRAIILRHTCTCTL